MNTNDDFLIQNHRDLLIVNSDKNQLIIEKEIFLNHNLLVETADNLSDAIKCLYVNSPKVILLDDIFSELDIVHTIRLLGRVEEDTIVILRTNQSDNEINLVSQNIHVFCKIEKTTQIETVIKLVNDAIQCYKDNQKKLNFLNLSTDWLKEELEWLLWKEEHTQTSQSTYGKKIIETIVHSIFQGLGVGGLLTLVDFLEMEKIEEGEYSKVKTQTLESVFHNAESIRIIKEKLDKVIHVFDLTYEKEIIRASELPVMIENCIKELEPFSGIKKQFIYLDKFSNTYDFYGNKKLIDISIKELLTNAFKYSPEKSIIYISIMHIENDVTVVITNPILPTPGGVSGIPKELEHKIFEPFFKINNIYDDRFFQEDLGFGVGLAVVQKGITSLGGKIHVYETTDHISSKKPTRKIIAALGFPKVIDGK